MDTSVRTPCVVEAHEERALHAEWPGFLSEVFVKDGDHVAQDQLLAVAHNEELDFSIRRQEAKIEEADARLRMLETQRPGRGAGGGGAPGALRKDLDMLLDRRKSLTFRAPFDGQVIAPNLERVQGRFLQLGDALFIVASLDKLDVTAVVDTADIPVDPRSEGKPVRIKFRSDPGRVYLGNIAHVYPSATNVAPASRAHQRRRRKRPSRPGRARGQAHAAALVQGQHRPGLQPGQTARRRHRRRRGSSWAGTRSERNCG